MRAVTFQAPGEVRVDDVPDPELQRPDDAIVAIEASGICGSDLHIFHGRVPVKIEHEGVDNRSRVLCPVRAPRVPFDGRNSLVSERNLLEEKFAYRISAER
jgi:hypothetical protein